ncbi:MAG: D-alanine--D-alanine ligase [Deltaproteobacteria bacterium CG07_land_8_20_14_0_80_60_11]|nr:MAG: D-alanine--D-alanine ligase [Deltaproteobacteria bacterium CG07_land_8_20_14_0_80_60_11]
MGKLRLALIAGGKSSEREVSLKSGAQVFQALNPDKYDIRRYDPLTDLERLVRDAEELDAALIIMHGRGGEDGSLQGLLDLLEIPYQGSGVLASALAMNKELSKAIYQMAGLKVPAALAFHREKAPSPPEIEAKLGLPVVIKPVHEGSSIGITKAASLEALSTGLAAAFALDNRVLVEEFIQGAEVTGGVLGNARLQALPLVEIIPASTYTFFDYEAKYQPGATEEICPARLSAELTKRAQECALTAHQALGCRGYSRTDMMIREQEIFVLETNTIPGMTATSLFPQGAKAAGIDFPDLLDTLIHLALEKEQ